MDGLWNWPQEQVAFIAVTLIVGLMLLAWVWLVFRTGRKR